MIDQEGIKSLEKGASNIRLTGNEGESSPIQEQLKKNMSESFPMREYMEEFERVFPDMIPLRGTEEYNDALEDYFRGLVKGPVLPSDEDPINPFGPKPIGPVLPDKSMMASSDSYNNYVKAAVSLGLKPIRIDEFESLTPIMDVNEILNLTEQLNRSTKATGGRIQAAFGGIMGLDQRKQYGIGSSFKKALNKVTRPFTKVARKLVPKEIAGPLRTIAPFLPPGFREAAYLAGTAKQKGKFNIGDLAFVAAPYARFEGTDPGEGIFGSRTKFKGFGRGTADDFGIRDLITGGEAGGAYEDIGGEGLLGKIRLGDSDLGQMSDEFLFGTPATEGSSQPLDPEATALGLPGAENVYVPGNPAQSGIFGSGGEMSTLGGDVGIMDSKMGQSLFGSKQKDGTFKPSILKLGSWGIGIASNIKAKKYKDEMEAADAAEDALLAENKAASEAEIQAARDWAMETFSKLTIADFAVGGRINKAMGGLSSLQTQASDVTPPGMELDLRGGGFIPIGKAEKADDVPARVSKNEFVFTADAVKAAGGGSVNQGAKRMYDTMKRLESQVA